MIDWLIDWLKLMYPMSDVWNGQTINWTKLNVKCSEWKQELHMWVGYTCCWVSDMTYPEEANNMVRPRNVWMEQIMLFESGFLFVSNISACITAVWQIDWSVALALTGNSGIAR